MRLQYSSPIARAWCVVACCWCASVFIFDAEAATLTEKARENGCTKKPVQVVGTSEMFKCETASGSSSYFNLQGAGSGGGSAARTAPTPAGFPKVDAGTQKGRDDIRRKVLSNELTAEEKLLAEARSKFRGSTPPPLPEEKADAYADRLGKLRIEVTLHEKNIEALKKELAALK